MGYHWAVHVWHKAQQAAGVVMGHGAANTPTHKASLLLSKSGPTVTRFISPWFFNQPRMGTTLSLKKGRT